MASHSLNHPFQVQYTLYFVCNGSSGDAVGRLDEQTKFGHVLPGGARLIKRVTVSLHTTFLE